MLRFTNDTISKYWDDPNYRIFSMRMNKDNILTVTSSNQTNSNLYEWNHDCIGKSLYEIMNQEHADRWHKRFYDWQNSGLISFIAYLEDNSPGWETTIEIVNNTLFGIGKKIENKRIDALSFDNYEFFNHYYVQQEKYLLLTLLTNMEKDLFIIESVDSNFDLDLSSYIGKDISSLTCFCSNILNKKVYRKCIQTKMEVHYVEQSSVKENPMYLDVHLYPYLSTSKIIIIAKNIDENTYKKNQKNLSNIYGIYPETNSFGVCEVNYENVHNAYIIGCNTYFKKLAFEEEIGLNLIVQHEAFIRCATTNASTTTGEFTLQKEGMQKKYIINVTHLPEIGNFVFLVVISLESQYYDSINSLFQRLSVRERQILTFVVEGFTNRYIANKLSISEGTVKKTIHNGYKKLDVCSRVDLMKLIYQE